MRCIADAGFIDLIWCYTKHALAGVVVAVIPFFFMLGLICFLELSKDHREWKKRSRK